MGVFFNIKEIVDFLKEHKVLSNENTFFYSTVNSLL